MLTPFPCFRNFALAAVVAAGCATAKEGAIQQPLTALNLYPAAVGNAWAHVVTNHTEGTSVLVTSQVTESSVQSFTVASGGQSVRYELRPNGIWKPESAYFMLRDPIQAGARWTLPEDSGEVRVERVSVRETVAAGSFEGCVVVVEELTGLQRAEWTYASGVGPVRMRVFDLSANPPALVVSAELRGYQIGGAQP